MKTIPLSQGQVALVDDDDYERLNKHKWHARWSPKTQSFYALRSSKKGEGLPRHTIYMARDIMHAQLGQEVDHKSHDTLDNRKVNMRLCTCSENLGNQKRHKKHSSQHKGVYWHKQHHKWHVYISCKGCRHHLGYFYDEDDAGHAYDRAALKYHGEFAWLNFPQHRNGIPPV